MDKRGKKNTSPNLVNIINRYNTLSIWIITSILEPNKVRLRAKRFEFFLKLVEHLRALNNFNTLMACVAALNNSAVSRLKYTKALCSKKLLEGLENVEKEMSTTSSFKTYRDLIKDCFDNQKPCLPYLAVHLSDLTKIEEANEDFYTFEEYQLVNVSKVILIQKTIDTLILMQNIPFNDLIYTHITKPQDQVSEQKAFNIIRDIVAPLSYEELYNLSLLREKKGARKKSII